VYCSFSRSTLSKSFKFVTCEVSLTREFWIQMFESNGPFIKAWGTPGSGEGQFRRPSDIVIDSSGHVYVADSGNHRIQFFRLSSPCPAGTTQITPGVGFCSKMGPQGQGNAQFDTPTGIVVDSSGFVYVTDFNNNRIQGFLWLPSDFGVFQDGNEPDIAVK
jgi:sugar lactone lactonase YvrE